MGTPARRPGFRGDMPPCATDRRCGTVPTRGRGVCVATTGGGGRIGRQPSGTAKDVEPAVGVM